MTPQETISANRVGLLMQGYLTGDTGLMQSILKAQEFDHQDQLADAAESGKQCLSTLERENSQQ